jgi:hypothetical protein
MYSAVTLDRRLSWTHHIERTVAKVLRTYVSICSLFKNKRLNTNIKLTPYKALMKSVMTYACPTWVSAVDSHLLKLHRLWNRVLRSVEDLDTGFQNSLCVCLCN